MRHWLLIFLIALIPFRAWAADAMTVAMSAAPGNAAHCAEHRSAAVTDIHIGANIDTHIEASPATAVDNLQSHAHCEVCNAAAMAASVPLSESTATLPHALVAPGCSDFVSAVLQRGHKPPIG